MLLNHYAPQFQWLQAKVRNILHGHQTATLARTASLVIFAFLAGCSNLPERNPVPVESTNIATIPGNHEQIVFCLRRRHASYRSDLGETQLTLGKGRTDKRQH
jgi:hypothetical protein